MQKINDDMTVAGALIAEQINGEPTGKLSEKINEKIDEVKQDIESSISGLLVEILSKTNDLINKSDRLIDLISEVIENKKEQEDIL